MFDISSPCEEESDSKPLLSENLTPRTKRKFDSVRNLLEKARAKLSLARSRQNSTSSEEQPLKSEEKLGSEPGSPVHLPRYNIIVFMLEYYLNFVIMVLQCNKGFNKQDFEQNQCK